MPSPSILSHENSILTAKVIALCGSGFITGGIFSLSYFTTPSLLLAPSIIAQRQWSHVYNLGKKTMPLLSLITASAYILLSRFYVSTTTSLRPPLSHHKPFLYLLSASLTLSIVPYTMIFMRANIAGLERAGQMLRKSNATAGAAGGAGKATAAGAGEDLEVMKIVEGRTTKQLLDEWGVLNLGRAALTGLGFVIGLWGSVVPVREVLVEVVETVKPR